MFDTTKITDILVAPNHVAERIQIKERPKHPRDHGRKEENRHQIHSHYRKDLNKVLDIPEIYPHRRENKGDANHGHGLKNKQERQQQVGPMERPVPNQNVADKDYSRNKLRDKRGKNAFYRKDFNRKDDLFYQISIGDNDCGTFVH